MTIDLRSDTVTRPSAGMMQAMMTAEVGDDVLRDDPTVHALELESAKMCGKEAALFTPSGTMANQLAIRGWTQPGDEVLMEAGSHPYNYESAAHAAISGVQIRPIPATLGILDPQDVADCIRPVDDHFAPARLLCVENTSNRGGGTVYPLDRLDELTNLAHTRGLKAHLDGARVFNAVAASGQPLARIAQGFDSVAFCLSKGLGAPVGSILCGPADFIVNARRMRKMLGGGMRQAGFLAAAGLYALRHNVDRLTEDHTRASVLYQGLLNMGIEAVEPQTNMVYASVSNANDLVQHLGEQEIQILAVNANTVRLVTHLDVDDQGIETMLQAMRAWTR
ncbi:MAG: low-specificity L-threonine aldolase [Myxococcota bacterium]|nr:low-specificity L-threonine aldolase [Myxococcota bacterium]